MQGTRSLFLFFDISSMIGDDCRDDYASRNEREVCKRLGNNLRRAQVEEQQACSQCVLEVD